MPRNDYQDTKHYNPPLLDDPNIPDEQKAHLRKVQHRYIHEGRVIAAYFVPLDNIDVCFPIIDFDCLYNINDQICPRFILEFYSHVRTFGDTEGNVFLDFLIQNQNISLSITEFGDILGIPSYGQYAYTEDHSFDSLFYHLEKEGTYLTELPDLETIKQHISLGRVVHTQKKRDGTIVHLDPNRLYLKEILLDLKN